MKTLLATLLASTVLMGSADASDYDIYECGDLKGNFVNKKDPAYKLIIVVWGDAGKLFPLEEYVVTVNGGYARASKRYESFTRHTKEVSNSEKNTIIGWELFDKNAVLSARGSFTIIDVVDHPTIASYRYTSKDGKWKMTARCHLGGEDIIAKEERGNQEKN